MWIRIRAVIVEDEPLAAQYLAAMLDDTCQVDVIGSAIESEAGLRLCAELRPDAVFVDISLPGRGVKDATLKKPRRIRLRLQFSCARWPKAAVLTPGYLVLG